jgi:hypothetical protein
MVSRQLELGFENRPGFKPAGRSRGRSDRAHYWFERMRGVVDEARDWPPEFPPLHAPRPDEVPASANPTFATGGEKLLISAPLAA